MLPVCGRMSRWGFTSDGLRGEGSFSDGMPLRNERGDVVLTFSGEEFPEPGTAQRLREQGHEFDVDGPAYLVHLYQEDPSFPARLEWKVSRATG